jgi:tRNA A-37 threonylcarbamoyl transferase component Bud32
MRPTDRDFPDAPDGFLRDPIETYVRPVLQDLAQQTSRIPPALIQALGPRYAIVRELGQGGMARVYLAFDHSLQRHVAVKVLQPEVSDAITAERFLREIEMTAQLHHSRIVPVHDRGEAAGLLYYIMQHFEGGSLRERLERSGPLSITDTIAIAKDVAGALDYAHAHGIVHRDIKPENILLEAEGAFVADFGVARLVEAERKKLTQTGMVIGTPYYMSPEQADAGQAVDGRSDIYALGCVVYEMLAGEPPFTGPDRRAVAAKHAAAPPPDLTLVRNTVTADMQHVIETALQKTPADRHPTAGAFVTALERASLRGAVTRPFSKGRKIAIAASVGVVVVAAIVLSAPRGSARLVLDPEKLVIAPITVHDSGLMEWRMSTVDWLSRTLDGAGPIRTVPASVIARKTRASPDADPIELARGLGAGLVVDGSLARAGHDSLRLVMIMRDVRTNTILTEISTSDQESRFDRLMDSATVALLRGMRHSGSPGPLVYASIGSSSLPAIKAFLRGEELYRRLDLPNARIAYGEAVRLDSNFAPALNKLSITMGWLQFGGDNGSDAFLLRAIQNNKGLGARDSLLLLADSVLVFAPLGNQTSQRALAILDGLARRYEDDAEIWDFYANIVLGRAPYIWNSSHPPSVENARNLFEHAVALDSLNVDALATSAMTSITLGDSITARRRLDGCLQTAPIGFGRTTCALLRAALDHPNDAATPMMLPTAPVWAQAQVLFAFAELPDANETGVAMARLMARNAPPNDARAPDFNMTMALARLLAARGHLAEAWRLVSRQEIKIPGPALAGQIAALGGAESDSMAALLRRSPMPLQRAEEWGTVWWLIARKDTTLLHGLARQSGLDVLRADWRRKIFAYYAVLAKAHSTLARGDTASALRILLAMPDSVCWTCETFRFTTARLLAATGRLDEAARWFSASPTIWDMGPLAVMWRLERARLSERMGHRAEAIDDYRYVAGMWQHADSVLLPYVAESRRALERLSSDR